MKKSFFSFLLCLTFYNLNVSAIEIFVSNAGNDITGIGTIDKPYLTINQARLIAKNFKATQDVNIFIRGGVYYLSSPLAFDSGDSGENGFKVKYCAYNNEVVILSGGQKVPSGYWLPDKKGIWKADLSAINPSNVVFRQLWVDDNKAQRSQCGIKITSTPVTQSDRNIYFDNTDANGVIISSVTHPEDIEIWTYWQWMANIVKVDAITGTKITTNIETPYYTGYQSTKDKPQNIFDIENAYEFIDVPGEWYYNKYTHYLYYYPLNNKNPNSSEIIFPILEKITTASNLLNVEFNGLTFLHSTWWIIPNNTGYKTGQGSIYITRDNKGLFNNQNLSSTTIEFSGCSNICIRNCAFIHLGAEAICFQNTSCNNLIDNNTFTDIAGTAIRIGNGQAYTYTNGTTATKNNIISNNIISNVANEFRSHCGIWLGFVNNNQVIKNKLSDLPYTGISTGYPYNGQEIQLGANTIEDNEISNVMNKLRDGGAIYNQAPNDIGQSYIRHNKICDVRLASDIAGIYLDQGSSNFLVANNYGNIMQNAIFTNFTDGNEINNSFNNNVFYGCSDHWINYDKYAPEYHTAAAGIGDLGVRFVDVNHDGLKDMVYYRWISSTNIQRGVYLNECGKWGNRLEDSPFCLPYHLYADGFGDFCVQFVDFDGDGYEDMLYSRAGYPDQCRAYRNTGSGWEYIPQFNPPIAFYQDGIGDLGVRFVDVNHDGFKDIVQYRWVNASQQIRRCFLHTNSGWQESFVPNYLLPYTITADGIGDLGVRFVDLNHDGYDDMLYWRWNYNQKGAYINTGAGWSYAPNYIPNYPTSLDGAGDLGVKFIDVDHDGTKDMVVNRKVTSSRQEKLAWLNQGGTWVAANSDYAPIIPTYIDYQGGTQGVLTIDLNGDGFDDILQNYWMQASQAYLNNSTTFYCSNSSALKSSENIIHDNPKEVDFIADMDVHFILNFSPNPFKENLKILLEVKNVEKVEVNLYSIGGVLVEEIANNVFEKGSYTLSLHSVLKPGIYLLRAKSNSYLQNKKIIRD